MMRAKLLIASIIVAATPAVAQQPRQLEVDLSNFKFQPNQIHLKAGESVRLHLVNAASGGHNFTAPDFFAHARIEPADAKAVVDGSVEIDGRQSRDIVLVPARGTYKLRCTHAFHKMFGMSGEIVVD
jgi:uncharacterized cupredoxin-like copper-binding protein